MNTTMTPELLEINRSAYYSPAVSVILPFDPKMSPKAELTLSLKVAIDKAEKELKNSYGSETVELMVSKLSALVAKLNFSTHRKSVAIYASPVFEKVLYLDIPVEEKVIVGDSFAIRDLVYNKKQLHQYLVLVLSGKQSRMYLGNGTSLVKIVSNSPASVYAYVNEVPEKVANFSDTSGRREIVMDKFLRHTDNALSIILNAYHLPLFVVGTERISGHFKSLTAHNGAVIEYVHGNYEEASERELAELLKPYTQQWEKIKQKDLMNRLEDAAGKKKLAIGMREVWREAKNHKGRLLVIEKDYMQPAARSSKKEIYMPAKPYNKFSNVKDAVDEIIQTVLESGGDVEFVDGDMLKEYDHIALIKYY